MKVFPVVHINSPEVAHHQANLALEYGADGVYLIEHPGGPAEIVLEALERLKTERPDSYVGVNLLGFTALEAVQKIHTFSDEHALAIPSGLWVDDLRNTNGVAPEAAFERKNTLPRLRGMRLLGGVAFKYTPTFTDDPILAVNEVRVLRSATDVITTSGSATGSAPSVAKITSMKAAAGTTPLAVASGISLENIERYRECVDEVLVASSIETAPYSGTFDEAKLKAFIDKAHSLS